MSERDEVLRRLNGRWVIASVSGGKDSAAMALWLKEMEIPHERVFLDTGWEHPALYEYLRGPLTKALGPITEVGSAGGMLALIREKGTFPSRTRRYCTTELKVKPMAGYIAHWRPVTGPIVNAVGIRADESLDRAAMDPWEQSEMLGCEVWRPILSWTLDDVIAIHHRHGLAPCPLYLRGHQRVGCWPCVNTSKAGLRIFGQDEERVAFLAALERELSEKAGAPRGWFQAFKGWNEMTGKRDGRPWPIEKAIEWASSYGQEELFVDATPGCMRWGLCDVLEADRATPPRDDADDAPTTSSLPETER